MSAPFYTNGSISENASLLFALVLGFGFGFFLERAGFGSARKLVAQFYLTDLAVFKVMFTAIVTAMLGVTILGAAGWLDVSQINLVPTFLWPQIAGGLVLGVGFVVGGYCPGTSLAALATGRLDALLYVLGFFAGTFVFAEAFPALEGFYTAGAFGARTLPEVLRLPHTIVVLAVLLLALVGFVGASKVESIFGDRESRKRS